MPHQYGDSGCCVASLGFATQRLWTEGTQRTRKSSCNRCSNGCSTSFVGRNVTPWYLKSTGCHGVGPVCVRRSQAASAFQPTCPEDRISGVMKPAACDSKSWCIKSQNWKWAATTITTSSCLALNSDDAAESKRKQF